MASDVDAIVSQWTDDFAVSHLPVQSCGDGLANAAAAEQGKEQMQALVIAVDYVVEFEEIIIAGDYAFEWGTYRGAVRSTRRWRAT